MLTKFQKGIVALVAVVTIFMGLNSLFALNTFAQSDDYYYDNGYNYDYDYDYSYGDPAANAAGAGFGIGVLICECIIILAIYVYMSLCLQKIAEKTGHADKKIYAWIPFLNMYLMTMIAKREIMWFIFMFIPFLNIVAGILVWMDIAKELKHPNWIGVLMIVPGIGIFVPGYLAFVEGKEA